MNMTVEDAVRAYQRGEIDKKTLKEVCARNGATPEQLTRLQSDSYSLKLPKELLVKTPSPYDDDRYTKELADNKKNERIDAIEQAIFEEDDDDKRELLEASLKAETGESTDLSFKEDKGK